MTRFIDFGPRLAYSHDRRLRLSFDNPRAPLNVPQRGLLSCLFAMVSTNTQFSIVIVLTAFASRSLQGTGLAESYDTQNLCPALSDNANATGEEPIPRKSKYGGLITDTNGLGQWKVAVQTNYSANSIESARSTAQEDTPDAVANVWMEPFEGIDLNNGDNSFSACAYLYKLIPDNTNLRGQEDDSTCEQMLSSNCVEELTKRASLTAQYLVQNPTLGPYSNLTVSLK